MPRRAGSFALEMLHLLIAMALSDGGPAAATTIASTGAATPCFPGKPPIAAADLYQRLEKYAWTLYGEDDPPPPVTTYGTCRVERNKITLPDGTLVAELGCGVRILAKGIYDDLGLQVGARGQDVLDRKPRPVRALRCFGNGPDQGRCIFDREPDHENTDSTMYVVDGALGETVLTGDDARRFFAAHAVVEIEYSVWCH